MFTSGADHFMARLGNPSSGTQPHGHVTTDSRVRSTALTSKNLPNASGEDYADGLTSETSKATPGPATGTPRQQTDGATSTMENGQEKTVAGVDLESEADWNAALTKNVSRCKNLDNLFVIVGTYFFLAGKPCTTTS